MRDAEDLLTQWGRWSRQQVGIPRCTSPSYVLMRDNVEQMDSLPAASITDDDALMIDRFVALMGRRKPDMADCIRVYYRGLDKTMAEVGKELGLARLKVRELIIAGHAFIEGCLEVRVAA
ncbi:hypothetical protein BK660_21840 [Pseudomonas brassicacearum]|uniref:Antitermination protein Q n=1 Tax=Pseudomonas brassicacearum TaxID=930166 RepID=A0A423HXH9_9PSED|nr:antiterminator Q family protein [Pseudomonas brassicacearum]RON17934.1 hypothetical protein BK660_21840 [Pseudomonas brassicacearum]